MSLLSIISWVPVGLAAAGLGYQGVAFAALARFFARPGSVPARGNEPVTILKPLYGAEPRLGENLASFLAQDYAGPMQLLCGVGSSGDGAVAAVRALAGAHPQADITLTTGPRAPGSNGKIGNLVAMLPAAMHDILVLSDSDMAVAPDYLSRILAALAEPGVGAVTCLYRGRGDGGVWSRIGAAMISTSTLPAMVMGLASGIARPCMGSTIAMRRATLEAIGGFAPFANVLADDHAIGEAVAGLGLAVAVPPLLLTHAGAEASLGALWRQHLRWAATVRSIAGAGHWGSGITHALPLALLATLCHPLPGLALVMVALALRLALARFVDRIGQKSATPSWIILIADCLAFAVFVASLRNRTIDWRGHRLTMTANGQIQGHPRPQTPKCQTPNPRDP
jgi:ceramide glucosyltransferase